MDGRLGLPLLLTAGILGGLLALLRWRAARGGPPTPAEVRRCYDLLAPAYDRREALADRLLLARRRRALVADLVGEVLESAAGTGANLPYYAPGVRLVACDSSFGMLAQLRRRAARLGRGVRLVQADAQRLPFRDASFDAAVSTLALCTVPDPAAAVAELRRCCRPGGQVRLLEHVLSPWPPVAWLQRLFAPFQLRRLGCRLDRPTVDRLRAAGHPVQVRDQGLAGVFVSLEVARGDSAVAAAPARTPLG